MMNGWVAKAMGWPFLLLVSSFHCFHFCFHLSEDCNFLDIGTMSYMRQPSRMCSEQINICISSTTLCALTDVHVYVWKRRIPYTGAWGSFLAQTSSQWLCFAHLLGQCPGWLADRLRQVDVCPSSSCVTHEWCVSHRDGESAAAKMHLFNVWHNLW